MAGFNPEDVRHSNLPVAPPGMVGRSRDLAQLAAEFERGIRFLTITGAGGCGKTRLAVELGYYFSSARPITMVSLAPVRVAGNVPTAIANELDIREGGTRPIIERITDELGRSPSLLILDNFEHLADVADLLETLLAECPDLWILVTSRRALQSATETVFFLRPLEVPQRDDAMTPEELEEFSAVKLFELRANEAFSDYVVDDGSRFAAAEIVRRVGGLPLAIELAAARCRHMTPQTLLEQLEPILPVLSGDNETLEERQHSMHATLQWSYRQLSEDTRAVFRRMAAFRGGFDVQAAKAIAAVTPAIGSRFLDILGFELLDHGLINRNDQEDGTTRYSMLEPVREFALEQLRLEREERTVRIAHARYFLDRAEEMRPKIESEEGADALRWFESEHGNLRAALATLVQQQRRFLAARLLLAIWKFLYVRRHLQEGRRMLDVVLDMFDAGNPSESEPELWYVSASFAQHSRDLATARDHAIRGIEVSKMLDDDFWHVGSLSVLAHVAAQEGDFERAIMHYDIVLAVMEPLIAQRPYVGHAKAVVLLALSSALFLLGRTEDAETRVIEALNIWLERGDKWGIGLARMSLARIAASNGDLENALSLYEDGVPLLWEVGDPASVAEGLAGLAEIAAQCQLLELAARLVGRAEALRSRDQSAGAVIISVDLDQILSQLEESSDWSRLQEILATFEHDRKVDIDSLIENAIGQLRSSVSGTDSAAEATAEDITTVIASNVVEIEHELTTREVEILCEVAQGKTDRQIADEKFIAYRTVTSHLEHIFSKLEVSNRASAIAWSFAHGVCPGASD